MRSAAFLVDARHGVCHQIIRGMNAVVQIIQRFQQLFLFFIYFFTRAAGIHVRAHGFIFQLRQASVEVAVQVFLKRIAFHCRLLPPFCSIRRAFCRKVPSFRSKLRVARHGHGKCGISRY